MESVLIAIVYHSGRGHTKRQAEAVKTGVEQVKGAEALLFTGEEAQTRWGDLATSNIDWQESSYFTKVLCKSRPGSVRWSGEPWRSRKRVILPPVLPDSKKFLRIELLTISLIGPPAAICWNYSNGVVKRRKRSHVPQA